MSAVKAASQVDRVLEPPSLSAPSVTFSPGDDVERIVADSPEGTQFVFLPGVYRTLEIVPKTGDVFIAKKGTILSGARVVSEFSNDGSFDIAKITLVRGQLHGTCEKEAEACQFPNDLFIDNVRQTPVFDKAAIMHGTFLMDYETGTLYLPANSDLRNVEIAVARHAFAGKAENVLIRGFVIEKYAIPAQMGAVGDNDHPSRWTVEDCEIRNNHGAGIQLGDFSRALNNFIHHNGQLGISGSGDYLMIEGNEISFNNVAGFDGGWEAGGIKLSHSVHAIIRNNFSHHNSGAGLWTDIDNIDTLYEGNRVEDNSGPGIQHEISFNAKIRDNWLARNGFGFHVWGWGAQILIQNSSGVEVSHNHIVVANEGNGISLIEQWRGDGKQSRYVVSNCYVHDNDIVMEGRRGWASSLLADYNASKILTSGNSFDHNKYFVSDLSARYWQWPLSRAISFGQLQKLYAQEIHGSLKNLANNVRNDTPAHMWPRATKPVAGQNQHF
jgi:hypothetical protein